MSPIEFGSKRFCLRALLWSGLLFKAQCDNMGMEDGGDRSELGMLGSPALDYRTITITTTIAYNPTPTPKPGDSTYSLLGCYSLGTDNLRGGHNPFGQEEGYTSPTVPPDKLTVNACIEACADQEYAGLMNGGECYCGSQLDSGASKLSPEECQTPCSGDNGLVCGGLSAIAVYSRVAASDVASTKGNEASGVRSIPFTGGGLLSLSATSKSADAKSDSSSTSEAVIFKTAGIATTIGTWSSSSSSSSPDKSGSGSTSTSSTIAAVTGSLSGAIILSALSVLCFRAYKRKKQREEDGDDQGTELKKNDKKKDRHSRRPIPSAINTKPGRARGKSKDFSDSAVHLSGPATDFKDMIPTTPALESGGRVPQHSGLHSRLKSPSSDRDTLYDTLMGEVRSGPALPTPPFPPSSAPIASSAASSAIQWPPQQTPTTASAALFDFGFDAPRPPNSPSGSTSSLVPSPATAARPDASLGPRAWHRRKLSTPFQPPASGPPSMPLPLTPPQRRQQQAGGLYGLDRSANASARSLGAESVPPPTPPLKDSPTLPRKMQPDAQGGLQGEGGEGGARVEKMEDAEPTLPVITPGEEFVARPRRGTMYVGPKDESDDDDKSVGSRSRRSSLSASTVATSILFTAEYHDDDRTWSGA